MEEEKDLETDKIISDVDEQTLGQTDNDAVDVNVGTPMSNTKETPDFVEKYLVCIVIVVIDGIVLLLMCTAFVLYKYVVSGK